MANKDIKQLEKDYKGLQDAKKKTDAENTRLKGVDAELVKSKEAIKVEQSKTTTLQGQYNELQKKSKGLEETVAGYEDPAALKDELAEKKKQSLSLESKVQELQKQIDSLGKEKRDLLSKDDRSSDAMKQVQEKEKRITTLENDLEAAKKKYAKYEGDFRFPPGGMPLLSVPMGDGKVTEFMLYEMKLPAASPPVIVKAVTHDGRALSVDFEKA